MRKYTLEMKKTMKSFKIIEKMIVLLGRRMHFIKTLIHSHLMKFQSELNLIRLIKIPLEN